MLFCERIFYFICLLLWYFLCFFVLTEYKKKIQCFLFCYFFAQSIYEKVGKCRKQKERIDFMGNDLLVSLAVMGLKVFLLIGICQRNSEE